MAESVKSSGQELKQLFRHLYAKDPKFRINSASRLKKILSEEQTGDSFSPNFIRIVERLISGSMVPKYSNKVGSTVMLTEILQSFPDFSVEQLLAMGKKIIGELDDKLSSEEVTSWTLIFTAIVQSKRLSTSEKGTMKELVRLMVQLSQKKSECSVAFCPIFEKLFDHEFDAPSFSKMLIKSIEMNDSERVSPFRLHLTLMLHKRPELSSVLEGSYMVDLDDIKALTKHVETSVSFLPTVHPALVELFHHLNDNNKIDLWKPIFNDPLFAQNKPQKNLLGFALIRTILPSLNESNVQQVFSPEMMTLWMSSLANKTTLYTDAMSIRDNLIKEYADYKAPLQEIIINTLTESPGTMTFDFLTKTRTIQDLFSKTKAEAVKALVDRTMDKIRKFKTSNDREKMRPLAVQQLWSLLKSEHLRDNTEITLSVLQFLLIYGFFDVSDDDSFKLKTPMNPALLDKIRITFFKICNEACNKNPSILESIGSYALKLIKSEIPVHDSGILPLWKRMKKMRIKFKKVEDDYEKQLSIFKPLFYGIALNSFQNPKEVTTLSENFEELVECYKRSLGECQDENEPKWPDVLLDMMISHFPTQSSFLASIMMKAFRPISREITIEGAQQLKTALLTRGFDEDDEGEDLDEEDLDDVDEGTNEKKQKGHKVGGESSEKMDGSEGEDSEDEEGEDEDDEDIRDDDVDDEFRAKVIAALGPAAEIGEEPEKPIDDEEMFQLDEALSEAFRSKFETKQNLATLKTLYSRCLDLVEVIFKSKEPSLELLLFLVPVLIDFIKIHKNDVELRNRASRILTTLPQVKVLKSFNSFDSKVAQNIFKKSTDLASKLDNPALQKSAAKVCVWIIALSRKAGQDVGCYFEQFLALLEEYFTKANSIVPKEFFAAILHDFPEDSRKQIFEVFRKHAFGNLRPFKKIGGIFMLTSFLRNSPPDSIKDKAIKSLLASIKKEALSGLSNSMSLSKRTKLAQEYVALLKAIEKFIPTPADQKTPLSTPAKTPSKSPKKRKSSESMHEVSEAVMKDDNEPIQEDTDKPKNNEEASSAEGEGEDEEKENVAHESSESKPDSEMAVENNQNGATGSDSSDEDQDESEKEEKSPIKATPKKVSVKDVEEKGFSSPSKPDKEGPTKKKVKLEVISETEADVDESKARTLRSRTKIPVPIRSKGESVPMDDEEGKDDDEANRLPEREKEKEESKSEGDTDMELTYVPRCEKVPATPTTRSRKRSTSQSTSEALLTPLRRSSRIKK